MLEIKFRAWINGGESSGFAHQMTYDLAFSEYAPVNGQLNAVFRSGDLMQYTGLKDCNGVEVYEGDILGDDRNECLWLVGFNERGCFIAHDPDNKLDFVLLDDYEFKVLGNIYENPELLESD